MPSLTAKRRPLPCLPWELQQRIFECLSANDIACTARILNKKAHDHFGDLEQKTIHLSQPVPHHAFKTRWCRGSAAWRALTHDKKQKLLDLTVKSGSLENFVFVVENMECEVSIQVPTVAAGAGHLHICEWLLTNQRCCWSGAFTEAAGQGHWRVCEWLLEHDLPAEDCAWKSDKNALVVSAQNGHIATFEWLLEILEFEGSAAAAEHTRNRVLEAAATGFDLATFKRLYPRLLQWPLQLFPDGNDTEDEEERQQRDGMGSSGGGEAACEEQAQVDVDQDEQQVTHQQEEKKEEQPAPPEVEQEQAAEPQIRTSPPPARPALDNDTLESIISAAAASPTPDWRDKVLWLEAQGYPRTSVACEVAAGKPHAIERLQWLMGRGYTVDEFVLQSAAMSGNVETLEYLLERFGFDDMSIFGEAATEAATAGHLPMLQYLWRRAEEDWEELGVDGLSLVFMAGLGGSTETVMWLVEACGVDCTKLAEERPVRAADARLLAWLHERGLPLSAQLVTWVAEGGCVEAMEWLVEAGCPMPTDGSPYAEAACHSDLPMLRCLRRLGCPWDETAAFTPLVRRVWQVASVDTLSWLLDAGCPVDWDKALQAAGAARRWDFADVRCILGEARHRREEAKAGRKRRRSGYFGYYGYGYYDDDDD